MAALITESDTTTCEVTMDPDLYDDASTSDMSRASDEIELEQLSPARAPPTGINSREARPCRCQICTDLHVAVIFNDIEALKDLLNAGNIDMNHETIPEYHAMHYALPLAIKTIREYHEEEFIKTREDMIELLLNAGCNTNSPDRNGLTPIYYAMKQGLKGVVQIIINNAEHPTDYNVLFEHVNGETLLLDIIDEMRYNWINSHFNWCLDFLLDHLKVNVNHPDRFHNTALHLATRNGDEQTVLILLRHGACVSSRNNANELALAYIQPKTLEMYLDECITTCEATSYDEYYGVFIDYGFLAHTKKTLENEKCKVPLIKNANEAILVPETDALLYMAQNEGFRQLLNHPVIASFMYMKWQRISCIAYANITFYSLMWLCLLLYLILGYGVEKKQSHSIEALNCMTYVGVIIGLILLIIRELCQLILSPVRYVKDFENWMEIVLIFITGWIVFHDSTQVSIKQQLSAVAILISSAELLVLIGQIPEFSTNILMLKTVSWNFFKFILWYCILIIAFALSFYTLFRQVAEDQTTPPPNLNNTENEKKEDFFNDPFRALFKTIVMLTGEFDAGSIQFSMFPVTSHIIFIMFVFMIPIVLFNLLNGLAVSDIQKIRDDAELVGLISRIELISYFESVVLGTETPIKCLSRHTTHLQGINTYIRNLKALCMKPFAKRIFLFPYFLYGYRIIVETFQDYKIIIQLDEPTRARLARERKARLKKYIETINSRIPGVIKYLKCNLDSKIVQNVKTVVRKKKNVKEFDEIKAKLLEIEAKSKIFEIKIESLETTNKRLETTLNKVLQTLKKKSVSRGINRLHF